MLLVGPKTYIGSTSKDRGLALYLKDRSVWEWERDGLVSELSGLVFKGRKRAFLGVMVKAFGGSSGLGFGITSGIVWKRAVMVPDLDHDPTGDNDFVSFARPNPLEKGLLSFKMCLPLGCIPSVLQSSAMPCLKWFIYVAGKRPEDQVAIPVDRVWVADPVRVKTIAPSRAVKPLPSATLCAELDSSCYYSGDVVKVFLKLSKPRGFKFDGFKLTLKQFLDVRVAPSKAAWRIKRNLNRVDYGRKWHKQCKGTSASTYYKDTEVVEECLEFVLDPKESARYGPVFLEAGAFRLAPSFSCLSLPPPSASSNVRLECSLGYYLNVHVVIPWSSDIIVPLALTMVSPGSTLVDAEDRSAGSDDRLPAAPPSSDTESSCPVPKEPDELVFEEDVQRALEELDVAEAGTAMRKIKTHHRQNPKDTIMAVRNLAISQVLLKEILDKKAAERSSLYARRLVRMAIMYQDADLNDAVRLLLTRILDRDTLTMERLEDGITRVSCLLLAYC